jgi:hypothetical protein
MTPRTYRGRRREETLLKLQEAGAEIVTREEPA